MLGEIEGERRLWWQRMSWLDSITDSIGHELGQTLGDSGGMQQSIGVKRIEPDLVSEQYTPQAECGPFPKRTALNYGLVSFYGLDNFIG